MPKGIVYMRSGEYDDDFFQNSVKPFLNSENDPKTGSDINGPHVKALSRTGKAYIVPIRNKDDITHAFYDLATHFNAVMAARNEFERRQIAQTELRKKEWTTFFTHLLNNSPQRYLGDVENERIAEDLAFTMSTAYQNINAPHLPNTNPPNPYGE